MSCSPARLAANRQNALKSTGPQTPEGKAAARLNAFRHGLAGAGDLVAPGADGDLIARRASAFARELDAPGTVGQMLAHRAALLSVRMEDAATRELAVVAANVRAAQDQFDRDRLDALNAGIEAIDAPGDPRAALDRLAATAEGAAYLALAWSDLRAEVHTGDRAAIAQAAAWLGLAPDAPLPADLPRQVDAEAHRIGALAASLVDGALVAAQRDEAGLRARFDPSPEATLARRYEAAAERGMFRAFRAIAELRRARDQEFVPLGLDPTPLPLVPREQPTPPPPPPPPLSPSLAPLGSFRAGDLTPPSPREMALHTSREPAPLAEGPRRQRPDLSQLTPNRR